MGGRKGKQDDSVLLMESALIYAAQVGGDLAVEHHLTVQKRRKKMRTRIERKKSFCGTKA